MIGTRSPSFGADLLIIQTLEDLVVGNGSASELQGTNATYTVTITPEASGTVTVDIAAGAAQDGAGNPSATADQFSIVADLTPVPALPMAGAIALAVLLLVGRGDSPMRLPFAVDSLACARVAIMLIPSYTAAALTGEMVWTTPTLAGASALAASLKRPEDPTRAVDEGDTDDASSEDAGPARQLVDGPARRGLLLTAAPVPPFGRSDGARSVGGAPGWTHRPPPSPSRLCVRLRLLHAGAGGSRPAGGLECRVLDPQPCAQHQQVQH